MKTALYKMSSNMFLGKCLAVVVEFSNAEIPMGFTRPEMLILVKSSDQAYNKIHSIQDISSTPLFTVKTPYLRIGSECMLGVFGDQHCNCEAERKVALELIEKNQGIYIHLPQEAQGHGLLYKSQELHLQVNGYMPDGTYLGCKSQPEAASLLKKGFIDVRNYDYVAEVLANIGIINYSYAFMSRNPKKVIDLANAGITITRMIDITTTIHEENIAETLTKWIVKGYCFTSDEALQITDLLASNNVILPSRAQKLIMKAADMYSTEEGNRLLEKNSHLSVEEKYQLKKAICSFPVNLHLKPVA